MNRKQFRCQEFGEDLRLYSVLDHQFDISYQNKENISFTMGSLYGNLTYIPVDANHPLPLVCPLTLHGHAASSDQV